MTELSPGAGCRPAAWLIAGTALVMPVLATLAALGLAPLLTLLALALVAIAPRQALAAFRDYRPFAILWLALCVWATASAASAVAEVSMVGPTASAVVASLRNSLLDTSSCIGKPSSTDKKTI